MKANSLQFLLLIIATALLAGCNTYGERSLKSFNKEFGQNLPVSPEYAIEPLGETHFSITVHQGAPLISSGARRLFYLRTAASTIAEAECKRLGWRKWRTDFTQEGNQGWVHLLADVTRQDFDEVEAALPRTGQEQSPQDKFSVGTGFFISDDGLLITCAHVVAGGAHVRLRTSDGAIPAIVIKLDSANDLALLKAEGKFSSLPIAPSRGVHLAATVATVGFPNIGMQGFSPKFARGDIGALSGAGDDARYFQISVPVQPGNSGGALVDERGNVVGVVSARLSDVAALRASGALPQNVNYAIKSSYLLSFLESLPEVSAKLKEPNTKEMKFEEVVKSAEQAAVLVLVY